MRFYKIFFRKCSWIEKNSKRLFFLSAVLLFIVYWACLTQAQYYWPYYQYYWPSSYSSYMPSAYYGYNSNSFIHSFYYNSYWPSFYRDSYKIYRSGFSSEKRYSSFDGNDRPFFDFLKTSRSNNNSESWVERKSIDRTSKVKAKSQTEVGAKSAKVKSD